MPVVVHRQPLAATARASFKQQYWTEFVKWKQQFDAWHGVLARIRRRPVTRPRRPGPAPPLSQLS